MLFDISPESNPSLYLSRRKELLTTIKQERKVGSSDILLLFASFEGDTEQFCQESSFFYLTGIREPGVVFVAQPDGVTTLYIPNCKKDRAQWIHTPVPFIQKNAEKHGVNYEDGKRPWHIECDMAFPSATQNEINKNEAGPIVALIKEQVRLQIAQEKQKQGATNANQTCLFI